jgi:hypothetical protein
MSQTGAEGKGGHRIWSAKLSDPGVLTFLGFK